MADCALVDGGMEWRESAGTQGVKRSTRDNLMNLVGPSQENIQDILDVYTVTVKERTLVA